MPLGMTIDCYSNAPSFDPATGYCDRNFSGGAGGNPVSGGVSSGNSNTNYPRGTTTQNPNPPPGFVAVGSSQWYRDVAGDGIYGRSLSTNYRKALQAVGGQIGFSYKDNKRNIHVDMRAIGRSAAGRPSGEASIRITTELLRNVAAARQSLGLGKSSELAVGKDVGQQMSSTSHANTILRSSLPGMLGDLQRWTSYLYSVVVAKAVFGNTIDPATNANCLPLYRFCVYCGFSGLSTSLGALKHRSKTGVPTSLKATTGSGVLKGVQLVRRMVSWQSKTQGTFYYSPNEAYAADKTGQLARYWNKSVVFVANTNNEDPFAKIQSEMTRQNIPNAVRQRVYDQVRRALRGASGSCL